MWRVDNISTITENGGTSRAATAILYNQTLKIRLSVHLLLPIHNPSCTNVIVSMHGFHRNSSHYRNIFMKYAEKSNICIIAPRFKHPKLLDKNSLIYGKMYEAKNFHDQLPKEIWTFKMVVDIFITLKEYLDIPAKKFDMFGHSAGGQFVQRFALFYDTTLVNRYVVANSGWYTLPDININFPHGVKNALDNKFLKKIFAKDLTIITGEKDIEYDRLNTKKATMLQGSTRHERAIYFYDFSKKISRKSHTQFNWKILTDPELTHSASRAAKIAWFKILKY